MEDSNQCRFVFKKIKKIELKNILFLKILVLFLSFSLKSDVHLFFHSEQRGDEGSYYSSLCSYLCTDINSDDSMRSCKDARHEEVSLYSS